MDDHDIVLDIACAIVDRPLFVDDAQADEDEEALAAGWRVLAALRIAAAQGGYNISPVGPS